MKCWLKSWGAMFAFCLGSAIAVQDSQAYGVIALNGIDLRGNSVWIDSFDSANPNISTDGRYDPARASTNGDVACMAGTLSLGYSRIKGSLFIGPTATLIAGSNSLVTGSIRRPLNIAFPDISRLEGLTLATPSPQVIDGITYDYIFNGGDADYRIDNLRGSIYVGPNSRIRIVLTSDAVATAIRVTGTGINAGKLTIFMDGPRFCSPGLVMVDNSNVTNLTYFGTTNNTQILLTGNESFIGTIYAPQADFSLGGGGSDVYDFIGATVTRSITVNGHISFHFDENLNSVGPCAPKVNTHPVSTTVPPRSDVVFWTDAAGPNLHFQWRLNGIDILV